jgi:peptide/nickel transport system ATP-binding protein
LKGGEPMAASDGTSPVDGGQVDGPAGAEPSPVIDVRGLRVRFKTGRGTVEAVRGVDFALHRGQCLAIVGESGSGKSVTSRALVGLVGAGAEVTAERMVLDGADLSGLTDRQWRRVRGARIGLVLQDALQSLDPIRPVGAEIAEVLRNHRTVERAAVPERVVDLLDRARVPEPALRARQYPHELSGGLRQRALIASAVAAEPDVLLADEPTTALDVTVQARVLDLLAARKADGTAILLISHDLSVVSRLADRVAVMYGGTFVEEGEAADLLRAPGHPYTRELLAAVPALHAKGTRLSVAAPEAAGAEPAGPAGCVFAARCPLADGQCRRVTPPVVDLGGGHSVRCWRTGQDWPAPAARIARVARIHPAAAAAPVIEVEHISKSYARPDRTRRQVVRDVSFTVAAGETLGLVGESGAGKTTVARIVLGLIEPDGGTVRLLGREWSGRKESDRRPLRDKIQLVPQDPLAAFDPRYTVERVIGEALGAPGSLAARRQRGRIGELLRLVGLEESVLGRHPRQLSGGQRQRVAIARALAPEPEVMICDEPVSALDVSVQAQILDLFADVQDRLGVAMVFISHDLGVVYHACDRVLVMRDAEVVETGAVRDVFGNPSEPYTKELIAALPQT